MNNKFRLPSLGCVAISLVACTAMSINELDQELIDTYVVKTQMTETDGPFAYTEGVSERFSLIATQAVQAANELGEDQKLNKISLLRIAATAQWQAADRPAPAGEATGPDAPRTEDDKPLLSVFAIAQQGKELCASEEIKGKQPRDCAYFEIVNTLNRQTMNGRALERYRSDDASLPTDERLKQTREYLLGATNAFKSITRHRATLSQNVVPVAYYRWLDRQRLYAFCDASVSFTEYLDVYRSMTPEERGGEDCGTRVGDAIAPVTMAMRNVLSPSFPPQPECANLIQTVGSWTFDAGQSTPAIPELSLGEGNICNR